MLSSTAMSWLIVMSGVIVLMIIGCITYALTESFKGEVGQVIRTRIVRKQIKRGEIQVSEDQLRQAVEAREEKPQRLSSWD